MGVVISLTNLPSALPACLVSLNYKTHLLVIRNSTHTIAAVDSAAAYQQVQADKRVNSTLVSSSYLLVLANGDQWCVVLL